MKKEVRDKLDSVNLHGTLDKCAKDLLNLKTELQKKYQRKYKEYWVEMDYSPYGDNPYQVWYVYGVRDETDQEEQAREKLEAEIEKQQKEYRLAQFERLKKEFGKK